jgi:hypothetical protein
VDLGELDPEPAHDLDQVVEPGEGFDFVVIVHQKIAATGALLEKHDPLARVRRILNHMRGRDKALCMPFPYLLSLHARLQK